MKQILFIYFNSVFFLFLWVKVNMNVDMIVPQVVWNSSTLLGIGRSMGENAEGLKCTYIVARYKGAGNTKEGYRRNVFKGNFSKAICKNLDEFIQGSENKTTIVSTTTSVAKVNKVSKVVKPGKVFNISYPKNNVKSSSDSKAGFSLSGNSSSISSLALPTSDGQVANSTDTLDTNDSVGYNADFSTDLLTHPSGKLNDSFHDQIVSRLNKNEKEAINGTLKNDGSNYNGDDVTRKTNEKNETSSNSIFYQRNETDSVTGHVKDSSASYVEIGAQAHNRFRNFHGSSPIHADSALTRGAESYAKELTTIGYIKHATLDGIGENIAYGCDTEPGYVLPAAEVTKRWYVIFLLRNMEKENVHFFVFIQN